LGAKGNAQNLMAPKVQQVRGRGPWKLFPVGNAHMQIVFFGKSKGQVSTKKGDRKMHLVRQAAGRITKHD
jgi:hypothetical protein